MSAVEGVGVDVVRGDGRLDPRVLPLRMLMPWPCCRIDRAVDGCIVTLPVTFTVELPEIDAWMVWPNVAQADAAPPR